MMSPDTPIGIFLGGLFGFASTWLLFFLVRFINTPANLYHEQKDRADRLEGLRQLVDGISHPPSFDMGFDFRGVNQSEIDEYYSSGMRFGATFKSQEVCRIWVENLEGHPINDCRVVIEDINPESPIRNGAMLFLDNRGVEEQETARFDLGSTEKSYLKFLRLSYSMSKESLVIEIESDQKPTGFLGVFDTPHLEFGKRYFVTLAVHGRNAYSRRMSITIEPVSEHQVLVSQNAHSARSKTIGA